MREVVRENSLYCTRLRNRIRVREREFVAQANSFFSIHLYLSTQLLGPSTRESEKLNNSILLSNVSKEFDWAEK